SAWDHDRYASRLPARRVAAPLSHVRSADAGDAPDFSACMAPARAGALPEIRDRGAVCHRRLLDVADHHQHDGRGARDPAGLLECCQGAPALEDNHVPEDHRARDAAVDVQGLSAYPGGRLPDDWRGRGYVLSIVSRWLCIV